MKKKDPDPNTDTLDRGMGPRIRIHTKMSWICNTAFLQVARRYGDFFIRQIHKFDDLNRGLRKIQL